MRRLIVLAVQVFMILLFTSPVHSAVYYVRSDGNDNNDGLSWATAKKTPFYILSKLAVSGDELWIASGRHSVVASPYYWKPGVSLYGGFAGNETSKDQRDCRVNVTYLSTSLISAGYTASTTIDGFTFYSEVTCGKSSPTITNNVFKQVKGLISGKPPVLICENASPVVSNNTFIGNGAGIRCREASAPIIRNNIIAYGSGISISSSAPLIINNTIVGTFSPTVEVSGQYTGYGDGAGLFCGNSSPTIANNIIAFCSNGVYADSSSNMVFKNNCVYSNGRYNFKGMDDPTGKNGNISADPGLVSEIYGDLHIQANSVCRNAGDDSSVDSSWPDVDSQARIQGDHVDIGADESDGTNWPEAMPRIVYVTPQGLDTNDGSSWTKAKRSVKAALSLLDNEGGQVWVAAGTYNEQIELPARVYLYGGFSGTENSLDQRSCKANPTIIDGQYKGTVVKILPGGYHMSLIDGFIIQNGVSSYYLPGAVITSIDASPIITNNVIRQTSMQSLGGRWAVFLHNALAVISGNTIRDINGEGIGGSLSVLTISKNSFINNYGTAISLYDHGGSICPHPSDCVIEDNIITGNSGAILAEGNNITIRRNIIAGNSGGVDCTYRGTTVPGHVVVTNNYFVGNISTLMPDNGSCFMLYRRPSFELANNKFVGNSGGIICQRSSGEIVNNTLAFNGTVGTYYNDTLTCIESSPLIANNIVAFSINGISRDDNSNPVVRNNCVYGNDEGNYIGFDSNLTGVEGNISADPMLASAEYGDIHILPDSPCRDAGDSSIIQTGWTDIDGGERTVGSQVDMGAVETDGSVPKVPANIIRVSPEGSDEHDGSSWDKATNNLQTAAYLAASRGGEVWVKDGVYNTLLQLMPFCYVYGGFAGNEISRDQRNWVTNESVLDLDYAFVAGISSSRFPCVFDGFTVQGAIKGTAVSIFESRATVTHNRIMGNATGISIMNGSTGPQPFSVDISNNQITGNKTGVTRWQGEGCKLVLTNNTISDNGCGVRVSSGTAMVQNNIVAFNTQGIQRQNVGKIDLYSNCVYGNNAFDYEGVAPGEGDISADPLFTDADNGDYHLLPDSLCLDAGINVPGIGEWDIDGQARAWRTVDMGADEYWPLSVQIDIRPGEFPNYINTSGKGLVSVAILTTPTFNALSVDPASLVFAGASPASRGNGSMVSRKDVDGDGDLDLLAQFCSSDLHLFPFVKSASLVGKIAGGDYVEGFDSVVVAK